MVRPKRLWGRRWLILAAAIGGLSSLSVVTALGGFVGGISNGPGFGSGALVAKAVANGSTCQSATSQIGSNASDCSNSLSPNGNIPTATGYPPMTLVQSAATANTSGVAVTSLTLTLGTATTNGNLLTLGVVVANNTTIAVSDSGGNSWQTALAPLYQSHANRETAIYYVDNATSDNSITVTFGAASTYPVMYLYELKNALLTGVLDATGSNSAPGNAIITVSTSSATTTNNDFAIAVVGTLGGNTLASAGWTVNTTYGNNANATGAEEIMTAAQVASFTTTTKDRFTAEIATFKVTGPVSQSLSGTATLSNLGTVSGQGSLTGGACGALGARDTTGQGNPGLIYGGVTGTTGPFTGSSALSFDGSTGWTETTKSYINPTPVSVAAWFKTTGSGTIVGATNVQGNTGQANWDRQLWVDNAGNVVFGVYNPTFEEVVSPGTYNNGAWHLAVATIGPVGEALYVDGSLVATNATPTAAQNYTAWWHIGWDSENTWPNAPTSAYFAGMIADVAVFPVQLTAANVSGLYGAGTSQTTYSAAVGALAPTSYWPMQNTGYLYPYAIPGGPALTSPSYPDISGNGNTGTGQGGLTLGVSGPYSDGGATSFDGSTGYVGTTTATNPQVLTEAIWFNATVGGVMLGLTNQQTNAIPTAYDRAIWMDSSGQVVYGDQPGAMQEVVSPLSYNDGKWHLAVAEVGPTGQKLYIDGVLVASNASYTAPGNYSGWWHIGYGYETTGWPNPPSGNYFNGSLADAVVYGSQLTGSEINSMWTASGEGEEVNAMLALSPASLWTLDGSTSTICGYTGISVQTTTGGTSTCLLPSGAGVCPTLNGSSDATLTSLAGKKLNLGTITGGGAVSITLATAQEGAVPAAYVGLHPTLSINLQLANVQWSADLHYGGAGWVL